MDPRSRISKSGKQTSSSYFETFMERLSFSTTALIRACSSGAPAEKELVRMQMFAARDV
jgi:hypothetical protein